MGPIIRSTLSMQESDTLGIVAAMDMFQRYSRDGRLRMDDLDVPALRAFELPRELKR